MRAIHTYGTLTDDERIEELILITSSLAGAYNELAAALIDQQREYLAAYVRSPGHSVAAKEREAQYYVEELSRQIIELRLKINNLVLARDLLAFLIRGNEPGKLPFPELAEAM